MLYHVARRRHDNRYYVEAELAVVVQLCHEMVGGRDQVAYLGIIHSLDRRLVPRRRPRLHLDEDHRRARPCDYVDFLVAVSPVGVEYLVAFVDEQLLSQFLALRA